MDLSIYDIIKGPVISDKAYRLNNKFKKLVLWVHPQANKPMVKDAIEKLFNVKVDKIGISVRKGKNKMARRKKITGITRKRAVVTLKEGYALDLVDQGATQQVVSQEVASAQPEQTAEKQ